MVEAVESVVVEAVDCCRLLCALESSSFVEAVESVVGAVDCCRLDYSSSYVEAVDCCRLLCTLENSCFVEAVEFC